MKLSRREAIRAAAVGVGAVAAGAVLPALPAAAVPTGGTYSLTIGGYFSEPIPWDASPETVKACAQWLLETAGYDARNSGTFC